MLCLPHDPCNRSLQPTFLLIRLYPTKKPHPPPKCLQHERESFAHYHGQVGSRSAPQILAVSKSSTLVLEQFGSSCTETRSGETPPLNTLVSIKTPSSPPSEQRANADADAGREALDASTMNDVVEGFRSKIHGHGCNGSIDREIGGYNAMDGGFDVEIGGSNAIDGGLDAEIKGSNAMDAGFDAEIEGSNAMDTGFDAEIEGSNAVDASVDVEIDGSYAVDAIFGVEVDGSNAMDAVFGIEIDGSNATDHGFDGKKPGFIHSSSASIPEAITKDPTTAKQLGYYDHFEINGHQKGLRNTYTTFTQNEEDTTDKVWYQNEEDTAYTTPYPHDNDHNQHNVTLIRAPSARVSESLIYLKSLGADCRRIVSEEPSIVACKATDLRGLVSELEGYGLEWKDLGRIFNLCPRILRMDPGTDLKAVASFLFGEVGLARKDFAKVVRRCPRLLACSVEGQLEPTLRFLQEMGFKDMGRVVASNATLLSFSVEHKILPKLRYLESIGLSSDDAVSMALRFPAIFNYSVEENLRPKYEYLTLVMGRNNRDLLSFPQFFGYSLDKKIRPRYERIARLRISLSLQAMLKLSEPEFNARFGSVDPEFSTPDSTAWSPNSTPDSTVRSPNSTPDSTARRPNSTPDSAAWRPNLMPRFGCMDPKFDARFDNVKPVHPHKAEEDMF